MKPRVVIDTNVLVSGSLSKHSVADRVVAAALSSCRVLVSALLLTEFEAVFRRTKFDRYTPLNDRLDYLRAFATAAVLVEVTHIVTACRDPKDNMILALALSGNADLIVTGDFDLLSLHPWRGIPILTPSTYLAESL